MGLKQSIRYNLIIILVSVNILADQISKYIVRLNVNAFEVIPIIKSYFTLTRIENSGAFLSFGDSFPPFIKIILLSVLPVLVIIAGFVFLFVKTHLSKLLVIGLCFILGGGAGNLYDRLVYGSVTDFLHMDFVVFQTGIFNLADVSIMIGMAIILVDSYLNNKKEKDLNV